MKTIFFALRRFYHVICFGTDFRADIGLLWFHYPNPGASWRRLGASWGRPGGVLGRPGDILGLLFEAKGIQNEALHLGWHFLIDFCPICPPKSIPEA